MCMLHAYDMHLISHRDMTLDNARANAFVYKNSFVAEEHGCSSELLRCNTSVAGIEIESIPTFQCNIIT